MPEDNDEVGSFINKNYKNYDLKFAYLERELSIASSRFNFEVESHSRVSQMLKLSACCTLLIVLLDLILHGLVIAYSSSAHPITSIEVLALAVSFSFCAGVYANSIALRLRRQLSRFRIKKLAQGRNSLFN